MSKRKLTGVHALAHGFLTFGIRPDDPMVRKIAPWDDWKTIASTLRASGMAVEVKPNPSFGECPRRQQVRGIAGSVVLGVEPTIHTLGVLSDLECVAAALTCREHNPSWSVDLRSASKVKTMAMNVVVRGYLIEREVPLPEHHTFQVSPLLRELFKLATEAETVGQGLLRLIKVPETGNVDSRWNHFLRLRLKKMVLQPKHQPALSRDTADGLEGCLAAVSAARPTGWVEIFDLFRTYANDQRVSLSDFKKLVTDAARQGRVELAPHNVPMMHSAEEMAKSAVRLGGFTFHLIRPRR